MSSSSPSSYVALEAIDSYDLDTDRQGLHTRLLTVEVAQDADTPKTSVARAVASSARRSRRLKCNCTSATFALSIVAKR